MLHSLGIPTWFLTLSTADLHWPEMIQAVALLLGIRLSRDDVLKMSFAQRSTYLWQNPITGVCMFQHILQSFFSQYLLNDTHPLGHITGYVIKVAFHMRGLQHAHCLLWVKDAPKINQDSDDDVWRIIDKYITVVVPKGVLESDANLMKSLQKFTHSDYCHRTNHVVLHFQNLLHQEQWSHTNLLKKTKPMTLPGMQKMYYKRCRMFSIIYWNSKGGFGYCRFVTKSWDRPWHIHVSFKNFTKRSQNNPATKSMWHIHKCM